MNGTRLTWKYWIDIFRRRQLEHDLDDEIRAHVALDVQQRIEGGEQADEARTAALREIGSVEAVKEATRDSWTWQAADRAIQDLRYSFRQLRKNPGFAIVAILTLAIGIGANSAIFSVVNTVILLPLAYHESARLVVVDEVTPGGRIPVNAMHFNEWRESARSFERMALIGGITMNLTGAGEPERIPAARVSPALFPMLGVQLKLGRTFLDEEDAPGRDHVVVIDNELWRRRFGSDPKIVGKMILLDDDKYEVVGVLPADFHFPQLSQLYAMTLAGLRPQLWKPFALRPQEMSPAGDHNFICIARLGSATSIAEARSELQIIMARIRSRMAPGWQLEAGVVSLHDQMIARSSGGLELMLAAVGIPLLVGCVNITHLLLTRISARRREIATRAAIGASRGQLIRQVLAESLVLSILGAACSIFIAYGAIGLILRVAPADIPRLDEIRLDVHVFLFSLTISIMTGLLVGLLPALQMAKAELNQVMMSASRTTTASRHSERLRSILVSLEVALTALCLITGGLLLRSFLNLLNVDRGFETERILTTDITFTENRYSTIEKKSDFLKTAIERLQALPGVTSVGVINKLPLGGAGSNNRMIPESAAIATRPTADIRTVNPDYLPTMGIIVYEGRTFDESDRNRNVALISKSTAERIWSGQSPIGKRFRFGAVTRPLIEVIGVAADIRGVALDHQPEFTAYVPYWQGSFNFRGVSFTVKTLGEPSTLSAAIRAAIRDIDSDIPLSAFRTMDDVMAESLAQRRFQMDLVLLFGLVAVVLAALGIYGTMSYAVAQRTNEVGIRIALGAEPRSVIREVLTDALRAVTIGLLIGLPIALATAAGMRSFLFGVAGQDPVTFLVTCVVLCVIAVFAAYIPARRASKIDPMIALRND